MQEIKNGISNPLITFTYNGTDKSDIPSMGTFVSKDRHLVISAESISDYCYIEKKHAKQTYKVTTRKGVRSVILPLN